MAQRSPLKNIPVFLAHEAVILLPCTMISLKLTASRKCWKTARLELPGITDLLFEDPQSTQLQYTHKIQVPPKYNPYTWVLFSVYIYFCSHKFTIHVQHGPDCKFCNQKFGQQQLYISLACSARLYPICVRSEAHRAWLRSARQTHGRLTG